MKMGLSAHDDSSCPVAFGFSFPKLIASVLADGLSKVLKEPLLHFSTQTVDAYRKKLELYTSLEASVLRERGVRVSLPELWMRPLWQAGFLDGREGLLFSWLSAQYEFERLRKCRAGAP